MLRETPSATSARRTVRGAHDLGEVGTRTLPRAVRRARLARSSAPSSRRAETLRLRDVVQRTGLGKGMCFRLLHTLHHCGLLEKVDASRYRLVSEIRRPQALPHRLRRARARTRSFARRGPGEPAARGRARGRRADRGQQPLPAEGGASQRRAPHPRARRPRHRVPDRRGGGARHRGQVPRGQHPAHRHRHPPSGRHLLRGQQLPGGAARGTLPRAVGADPLERAGRRGAAAGARARGLARARAHERRRSPASRRRCTRRSTPARVVSLDGDGQFKTSLEKVRRHLRGRRRGTSWWGRPTTPARWARRGPSRRRGGPGRARSSARTREPDARAELREPRTPLIASVGFFPERYGDGLIKLAFDILAHRQTPPALFIRHQLITTENVDHFYPNDALLGHVATAGPA